MPASNTMTVVQFARLVGFPDVLAILDLRDPENLAADPRLGLGERPRRITTAVVP